MDFADTVLIPTMTFQIRMSGEQVIPFERKKNTENIQISRQQFPTKIALIARDLLQFACTLVKFKKFLTK